MDAVLSSERALYPPQFLNAAIVRCKAEQAKKDDAGRPVRHVSYHRAAILKACINRHFRIHEPNRKEISVSLDIQNTDKPYLLGRLFAAYERIQEVAAERDLNRTIRDSFFGAAMATPISAFPRLVRLNQHHLRDVKRGRASSAKYFDALLQEINGKLTSPPFPSNFLLKDQGVFALGYYHQRHAFFTKSDNKQSTTKEQTA
jgi:CRISPR-associated protein Csd1